ncbi:MAG: hypothetical protein Q9M28_10470 [Mariprofundaceae bacterium]|nr:hypothetical protein [Mariprofundaceae bacterium]
MSQYEELYKHAKYAFDEENLRFGRVEDKAARFITVVTSLLAVYALTVRQLFGDIIPAENNMEVVLLVLGAFILLGLLVSWIFAFKALHVQGLEKPSLNENVVMFYLDNKLINIYVAMAKRFSMSLKHNMAITNLKVKAVKHSFWWIVVTVIFFTLFIIANVVSEYSTNSEGNMIETMPSEENNNKDLSDLKSPLKIKKETKMSQNSSIQPKPYVESTKTPEPTKTAEPIKTPEPIETPDLDIVAPEFNLATESFDATKLLDEKVLKE